MFFSVVLSFLFATPAIDVLHAWDAARAHAFVAADRSALAGLYADGSRAGARDLKLFDRYDAAGVGVTSMRTQIFAARPGAVSSRRVSIEVVDRVVATGADGSRCLRLPSSPARAERVTLRRRDGRWVVSSVNGAGQWPARR